MAGLEQKLKQYYENNLDYQPSEEFAARLAALESLPSAAPKRRGRYVLPIAAALALALGLSGWALLRSPQKPEQPWVQAPVAVQTPAPVTENTGDRTELSKPPVPEENKAPAPKKQAPAPSPAEPTKKDAAQPAAQEHTAPADIVLTPPEAAPPAVPDLPAAPEDEPAPEPEEAGQTPVKPEEPADEKPEEPDEPENETSEAPVKPEEPPEERPNEDDPTPSGDPQIIHLEENGIDASYLMEDGRETLALKCLSTGASVELDLTGWQEELAEAPGAPSPEGPPEAAPAAPAYAVRSNVIDVVFDKNIVFYLILEEDGTVRVKLDVTDAEA